MVEYLCSRTLKEPNVLCPVSTCSQLRMSLFGSLFEQCSPCACYGLIWESQYLLCRFLWFSLRSLLILMLSSLSMLSKLWTIRPMKWVSLPIWPLPPLEWLDLLLTRGASEFSAIVRAAILCSVNQLINPCLLLDHEIGECKGLGSRGEGHASPRLGPSLEAGVLPVHVGPCVDPTVLYGSLE